jgi:hypothetical protein
VNWKDQKSRFAADVMALVERHRAAGVGSDVMSAALLHTASALVLSEGVSNADVFAGGAKIAFVAVRESIKRGGVQA